MFVIKIVPTKRFGDQLPPDEDVSTSKACGTVDFCQNKVNLKTSPEITVENDETVAEIDPLRI